MRLGLQRSVRRGARRTQRRLGRQGLRFRVYMLVSVGVLAPAALVAGVSWMRLRELDDELLGSRRHAAAAVAEHLDEETTGDLETLQRLASTPGLLSGSAEAARAALRGAYLHSRFVSGVFLLDGAGREVAAEPPGHAVAPPADTPEVRASLEDGKPRVTSLVGPGRAEGRTYALVSVMDWRGQPVGLVGGVLEPSTPIRARVLRHLEKRGGGWADLVDGQGTVLASTDRARHRLAEPCAARVAQLIRERKAQVGRCRDCHADGWPWIMAVAPLTTAPWAVAVVQPESAVLATSGAVPRSFPLFAAGLVALAGIFAWGAAQSVTRPIALLTDAAERVAAGRMDEHIPELGTDELGRLGRSVERMRASLAFLVGRVELANEQLEARVEDRTRELGRANAELRERDAHRQRLLRMVITAQEDERKRIARELHDETTQSLAVLTMGLESAAAALRSGGPTPRLDEVKAVAVRTLEEVHRLILDLRPAVLDDLGLFPALRWYAERHLESRGLAVRCEIQELDRKLPPEVAIALFRIGQETMNNIARHAKAESVLVQLGHDEREIWIEIEDDGQGFDPSRAPQDRPHYGLLGILERAELLGGRAVIDSAPGKGTRVEVRVPLPAEAVASGPAARAVSSVTP
ncbi:MAG TPA: histidine kinase [Anaeromyxobacteraceae bacterium]|nr:histidine kinase [Anaeromyxobacteraceae bacterium]